MIDMEEVRRRLREEGFTDAEIQAVKKIAEMMPGIVESLSELWENVMVGMEELSESLSEWAESVLNPTLLDLAKFAEEAREEAEERKSERSKWHMRPCTVKINTKGHQRRPCRVARSMRRNGRK